jgi:hypothetical protein
MTQRSAKKNQSIFSFLLRGQALAEFFAVVTTIVGDFGLKETAMAAAFGVDFFGLENEPGRGPDRCRVVWFAQHFVEIAEGDGGVEVGLAGGCALGLHVLEGFLGGGQDAVEALFVHGEVYEGLGVLEEDSSGGEGGVDFRVTRVYLALLAKVAEGEHAFFEGADAVEPPLRIDDGLGALALGEGLGSETGEVFFGEFSVSVEILGGQDDYAGGQAVAKSVQAGDLLASFTSRARTMLSVTAVGLHLDHV